jgi:endoglycosylceramidase
VKIAKLEALAQPYATLTAGTPGARSYDPAARDFGYVYRTKPPGKGRKFGPGSITKVSVPAIEYPAGYRVRVRGARVLSRPGARVLLLAQCGRAKRVKLSVSPGRLRAAARKCG